MMDTFLLELLLFIFEISTIKKWILSHSNNVILCKLGNILSDLHMYRLIFFFFYLFVLTYAIKLKYFARNEKWFQIWTFPMKKRQILFNFHCLGSLYSKNGNFDFESHWNTLIFLIKKMMSNLNMFYQAVSDSV